MKQTLFHMRLFNSGTQHVASHHGGYFKEDCGLSFVGKEKGQFNKRWICIY